MRGHAVLSPCPHAISILQRLAPYGYKLLWMVEVDNLTLRFDLFFHLLYPVVKSELVERPSVRVKRIGKKRGIGIVSHLFLV